MILAFPELILTDGEALIIFNSLIIIDYLF
jgi:hypothetical protein